MQGSRTEHSRREEIDAAPSTPSKVRLAILGGVAAVLTGALYLIAVRGEALLLDLSALAAWCF